MTARRFLVLLLAALLFCGNAVPAQNDLKSGPQPGDNLPGPFLSLVAYFHKPTLVGTKTDFVEQYGADPAAQICAKKLGSR
jgi:hypothetical protein